DLELLPTAVNPNARLAILPAGTGDDFARGLRRGRKPLKSWIETFLSDGSNNATQIDVLYGRSNDFEKPFICLNASTMGIGGETAARVAAQGKLMRRFPGGFSFLYAGLGAPARRG